MVLNRIKQGIDQLLEPCRYNDRQKDSNKDSRPVEYRLDQDRVVRPKRYSTGRYVVYPILYMQFQEKLLNMFA